MHERRGKITRKGIGVCMLILAAGLQFGIGTESEKNVSYAAKVDSNLCREVQENVLEASSEVDNVTTGAAVTSTAVTSAAANGWVQENGKWHFYEDGIAQEKEAGWYKISKKWYYLKKNGSTYSGWQIVKGKKYYFNKRGVFSDGWIKVGKNQYYQTKKNGLYKNAVIKNSSNGKYYYVDESGKKIDNKMTKYLVKAYRECTNENMTKEKKMYALYMYLATPSSRNKHFKYERRYDDYKYIGRSGWTSDYAYQILSTGRGNCYRFACCFGYFAKMLGYDSYVQVGQCSARRGGYTPHSWVEIKMNGKTYVYDPELQFAGSASNLYKKTYSTYPITIKKGKSYKIKF